MSSDYSDMMFSWFNANVSIVPFVSLKLLIVELNVWFTNVCHFTIAILTTIKWNQLNDVKRKSNDDTITFCRATWHPRWNIYHWWALQQTLHVASSCFVKLNFPFLCFLSILLLKRGKSQFHYVFCIVIIHYQAVCSMPS